MIKKRQLRQNDLDILIQTGKMSCEIAGVVDFKYDSKYKILYVLYNGEERYDEHYVSSDSDKLRIIKIINNKAKFCFKVGDETQVPKYNPIKQDKNDLPKDNETIKKLRDAVALLRRYGYEVYYPTVKWIQRDKEGNIL